MTKKENNHPVLKAAAVTAAAGTAAYGGYAYVIFREAFDLLHSHYSGAMVLDGRNMERNNRWFAESIKADDVQKSFDGLNLHAARVQNHQEGHNWIILLHGYHADSRSMMDWMYEFDQRGYNLLVPDARACGASEGRYSGLGWPEHYDLISWCAYLCTLDPKAKITLFGVSTGASTVMNAVGDYLPKNVVCAIEDSGYSDIKEALIYAADKESSVPTRPFMPAVDFFVKQNLHFSFYDVSTVRQLSRARIPMLFIHGEADAVVPVGMVHDCYSACMSEKEIVTYKEAGHGMSRFQDGYYEKICDFVKKYMNS